MARESEITLYSVAGSANLLGEGAPAAFPLSSVGPRSGPLRVRAATIRPHGTAAVSLDSLLAPRPLRARAVGCLRAAVRPDHARRAGPPLRLRPGEHCARDVP